MFWIPPLTNRRLSRYFFWSIGQSSLPSSSESCTIDVKMKIDRSKVKKSCSEVPLDCRNLIDKLKVGYSIRLNFFPFKFSKGIQSLSYKLYPVLVLVGSGNSFFFGSSTSLEFLNWLLSNFNDLISLVGLFTHRVPERAERHRNMDLREVRALPLD